MQEIDDAVDRIIAGLEKKNRLINENERRIVAYHEAGHAIVAERVPTADPVHKISIIPAAWRRSATRSSSPPRIGTCSRSRS
jgi:cell division protease FtsH